MNGYAVVTKDAWELVKYDHSRGKTQVDFENDYNDPIHWYNGNNFQSVLAVGEIKRDLPSDASTIFDYINKLSNDEMKDQDHYLVLGLDHLRYRATDNQIKAAYRKACLLFHPDRHHTKYELPHSQFVHITRAYEVLYDAEKRQTYDSVDGEFDDTIPAESSSSSTGDFYELFGRALYRNARWSTEQPVPLVGNEKTSYGHAQKFYTFWKNFRSKREFSHLDEQPIESGDCREERRYLTKLNKKQREEHKKNENKRIRQLIDNCRASDPRIARYTQIKADRTKLEKEQKKKRQLLKKASKNSFSIDIASESVHSVDRTNNKKQNTSSAAAAASSPPQVETSADDKEKKILEREHKKLMKKLLDEQKHKLREFVETHHYFVKSKENKLKNIEQFDKFIKIIKLPDIQELNLQLEKLHLDFDSCVTVYNNKLDEYYKPNNDDSINIPITKSETIADVATTTTTTTQQSTNQPIQQDTWTKERIVVLLKAMKTYPAGTKSRYEIVTEYINNHAKCNFNVKQIIHQAKTLTVNQDTNVIKMVAEQKPVPSQAESKENVAKQRVGSQSEQGSTSSEWSAEEQKLFQQALKNIPIGTENRWLKISTLIPSKTPLQCQKRLKYLCEMIKKKKEQP